MSDPENIKKRISGFFPGYDADVVFQPTAGVVSISLRKPIDDEQVAHITADTTKKVMTHALVEGLLVQLQEKDDPGY